jgi:hypothetical protein
LGLFASLFFAQSFRCQAASSEGPSYNDSEIRQWMSGLAHGWIRPAPEAKLPLTCRGVETQTGLLEPYPSPMPSQGLEANASRIDEQGRLCRFSALDRLDLNVLSADKRVSSKFVSIRKISTRAVAPGGAIEIYFDRDAYYILLRRSTNFKPSTVERSFAWYQYGASLSSGPTPSLNKLLARINEAFDRGRLRAGFAGEFEAVEGWPYIESRALALVLSQSSADQEFRLVGRPTTLEYLKEILAAPEGLKGPASSQLVDAIELAYSDDGRIDESERKTIAEGWSRLKERAQLSFEARRFEDLARSILRIAL